MTQFNSASYDVQRPSGQCAFTGRQMEPGEVYIATLVEDGDSFQRVDVSLEAWERGDRPEHLFSFWRTTQPEPEQKRKLFVDDEVLMNLLRRLEDADQFQRVAFRFVLALILMRKKLLRYDGSERGPAPTTSFAPPPPPPSEPTATNEEADEQAEQSPEAEAPAEPEAERDGEWWLMTPKLDVSKGRMGKWDEQGQMKVLDPELDEQGIRQVTEQLSEILQAEL